jgi:hypothetical protein
LAAGASILGALAVSCMIFYAKKLLQDFIDHGVAFITHGVMALVMVVSFKFPNRLNDIVFNESTRPHSV